MPRDYVERILRARVYDVAHETPLTEAPLLSRRLGNKILLKREDLQPVFSFKLRGAYNKMVNLSTEQQARGVVAASAGNHAQGVALAAQRLGIHATIFMPVTTPHIKVQAVRDLGAEIVLHGESFDDAQQAAERRAQQRVEVFVHPFDDPDVIAGQGTVAMEILRQHSDPIYAIFVAIGGGGLIAGVSAYVKSLWPRIKVIGVEPEDAASMQASLQARHRVRLDHVGIFADGVAVKQVGAEPFRIVQQCVDEVLTVTTDEICAGIKDIYEDTRSIAEPAGAVSLAGLKRYVEREGLRDQTLVAINCGANVNFDRLRHIAERADIGEHTEALLAVTIPERPGSLKTFCESIGSRGITEFNYRYADAGDAHIFVGVELREGAADRAALVSALQGAGYPVVDMTDNEMAKTHVRFMVGGHAHSAVPERVFQFNFPERPGALLRFLSRMGQHWNIGMFHYRNHGADFGRVLMGLQVPAAEEEAFQSFLQELGYEWQEETDNPAYELFLR